MAVHGVFKDALVAVEQFDLSGISNNAAINLTTEELDDTVFGATARGVAPGLTDGDIQVAALWDVDVHDLLLDQPGNDETDDEGAITFAPVKTLAGVCLLSTGSIGSVSNGGAVGELYAGSVAVNLKELVVSGVLAELGQTSRTASSASAGNNTGALSATQSLYATLHIVTITTGGTLDVTIESDATDAWVGAETTRITFPQVTSTRVAYFRSVAGAITDAWWRMKYVIGGGGEYKFVVGFGIK